MSGSRNIQKLLRSVMVLGALLIATPTLGNQGVWKGRIGNASVVACFDHSARGSYYYEKYDAPIILQKNADGKWLEKSREDGKSSGSWTLNGSAGDTMSGTWSWHGRESKPIKLYKIGNIDDLSWHLLNDSPCASSEYFSLIEEKAGQRSYGVQSPNYFENDRARQFDLHWRKRGHVSVETVRIESGDAAVHRINEALENDLPKENDMQMFFEETFKFNGVLTRKAGPSIHGSPFYWTANYFVVRYQVLRDYNPHIESRRRPTEVEEYIYRTFDLKSGNEISVWSWLGQNNFKPCGSVLTDNCGYGRPSAKLLPLIARHLKRDRSDECGADVEKGGVDFQATVSDAGILFSVYRMEKSRSCILRAEVPFSQLMPILTKSGVDSVRRIQEKQ
ncbi:MAG: hypothetical protein L6Q60_06665 [Rhodocyclaceae bacterium]|nr:hypothetical protein [Rhodocyclaceae bacterium]